LIELTGGEPLIQDGAAELLHGLEGIEGVRVLIETNGTQDISVVPDGVIAVMDVKCPSSGQQEWFDEANIGRLRPHDEVKFVISCRDDYQWAREFIISHDLTKKCNAVLLSAVHGVPGAAALADWILEDRMNVRFQLQLHKAIGHQ